MQLIDLHIHTTGSDGTLSPRETVEYAVKKGLSAIAITDHDTVSAVLPAQKAAEGTELEVVSGIEVSADYKGYGIHILGYFVDPASEALQRVLDAVIAGREERNAQIVRLMQEDGLKINLGDLGRMFPDSVIGRPHIAAWLVKAGLAETTEEAFTHYLNRGCPYYRKRRYLPMTEAMEILRLAGGKPVFAHPLQYRMEEVERLRLTALLRDLGAKGMECVYSGYTPGQQSRLLEIAESFGLCPTGGSDFHGKSKPQIDMGSGTGGMQVPYRFLEELKKA